MSISFKKISTLVLAVLLVTIIGCRANPVRQVNEAPVMASGQYSVKDVKKAIIKAGQSIGWGMKPVKPGLIIGTIFVRNHMAKIEIKYNKNNYSIHYKDSAGLKYDGTNIHRSYNNWIKNLEQRINSQLSGL